MRASGTAVIESSSPQASSAPSTAYPLSGSSTACCSQPAAQSAARAAISAGSAATSSSVSGSEELKPRTSSVASWTTRDGRLPHSETASTAHSAARHERQVSPKSSTPTGTGRPSSPRRASRFRSLASP